MMTGALDIRRHINIPYGEHRGDIGTYNINSWDVTYRYQINVDGVIHNPDTVWIGGQIRMKRYGKKNIRFAGWIDATYTGKVPITNFERKDVEFILPNTADVRDKLVDVVQKLVDDNIVDMIKKVEARI